MVLFVAGFQFEMNPMLPLVPLVAMTAFVVGMTALFRAFPKEAKKYKIMYKLVTERPKKVTGVGAILSLSIKMIISIIVASMVLFVAGFQFEMNPMLPLVAMTAFVVGMTALFRAFPKESKKYKNMYKLVTERPTRVTGVGAILMSEGYFKIAEEDRCGVSDKFKEDYGYHQPMVVPPAGLKDRAGKYVPDILVGTAIIAKKNLINFDNIYYHSFKKGIPLAECLNGEEQWEAEVRRAKELYTEMEPHRFPLLLSREGKNPHESVYDCLVRLLAEEHQEKINDDTRSSKYSSPDAYLVHRKSGTATAVYLINSADLTPCVESEKERGLSNFFCSINFIKSINVDINKDYLETRSCGYVKCKDAVNRIHQFAKKHIKCDLRKWGQIDAWKLLKPLLDNKHYELFGVV